MVEGQLAKTCWKRRKSFCVVKKEHLIKTQYIYCTDITKRSLLHMFVYKHQFAVPNTNMFANDRWGFDYLCRKSL